MGATLSELRDALILLCNCNPEIANRRVAIASECGYAGAYISSPVVLYRYIGDTDLIHIYTDDDRDIDDVIDVVKYSVREE